MCTIAGRRYWRKKRGEGRGLCCCVIHHYVCLYSSLAVEEHMDLTDKVFPEPVWAMPTMSLPLRARGKPCAWMAVGSLKFCCISTSITYSWWRQKKYIYSDYFCDNRHGLVSRFSVLCSSSFAYGETVPDGSWWWVLGSLSLEQWFPSSCDTPQPHTENTRQQVQTYTDWSQVFLMLSFHASNKGLQDLSASDDQTVIFREYLTHSLHFRMFTIKVFLKFGQLIQVPSLLA